MITEESATKFVPDMSTIVWYVPVKGENDSIVGAVNNFNILSPLGVPRPVTASHPVVVL